MSATSSDERSKIPMMAATKKEKAADAAATYDEVFDLLAEARDGDAVEAIRRNPMLRANQEILVTTILALPDVQESRLAARTMRKLDTDAELQGIANDG